jgi:hypothetical protein
MQGPLATLKALSPSTGKVGDKITVYGASFGATQGDSWISLDDVPLPGATASWADTQIEFVIPNAPPKSGDWTKPTQLVNVGINVGGIDAATGLPLTVTS